MLTKIAKKTRFNAINFMVSNINKSETQFELLTLIYYARH